MKFYVTERIGPRRSLTPEGFLLCQDVPIARVGVMDYHESELPLEAERGVIRVQRLEEEVFAPAAMASFAGKPVVDDHPDEDVTPLTWKKLAIGTIQNPRRGEGNLSDVLLADLLITDVDGIKAVQAGKVEVSCGYDAEYEQLSPGLAKQYSIIGNHVALVEAGRCGPRCSIGDQAISVTLERQMSKVVVKKPLSFKDRLMAAFKNKDEAAIEKLAGEVTEDEEIAENDLKGGSANGITINVHGNSGAPAAAAEKSTSDEDTDKDKDKDDPMKPVMDAIGALGERLTKLEGGTSTTSDADGDDDDDDDTSTTDAEGDEDEDDDKDKDKGKDKTKDGKGKTRDSAGLANTFQDTVARAEILSPGIKVPTFDAKADRTKTRDALCAFRRKVLDKAYGTDEGRASIDAVLAGSKLKTKDMTCDAAKILFTAASENMKEVNRAANTGSGKVRTGDTGSVKVGSIADMNKVSADFWKPKI